MLLKGCHDKSVLRPAKNIFWPNTCTVKAIASIWSRYFFISFCHGAHYLIPIIHTPSLSSRCLWSTWAVTKLVMSSSSISQIMSGRTDCLHILVHCRFPFYTHHYPPTTLPPAKVFSSSPFPVSPSCLLKAGDNTNLTGDSPLHQTLHISHPVP